MGAFGQAMGRHFRLDAAPVVIAQTLRKVDFASTRLTTASPNHGLTLPIPREDSFLVALQLADFRTHELWLGGTAVRPVPYLRGTFSAVNLDLEPAAYLRDPFDCIHFYLPRRTLIRAARERGGPAPDGHIWRPGISYDDSVIFGLGMALLPALKNPAEASQLYIDHIAAALHDHVLHKYVGMRQVEFSGGGLAPWQLRRATEMLRAHLNGELSLQTVAHACGLSLSHFSRAFKTSTGQPPHRWLIRRRVELARHMLSTTTASLTDIAIACGFADQAHFTRVFRQCIGASPGTWRRITRN